MQGGKEGGSDYAAMFNRFFGDARLSSTYKPVLVAALVDISDEGTGARLLARGEWARREGDRIRVDLNLVAALFARFYWDMAAGLGLRHMSPRMADPDDPDRDVAIGDPIKEELEKEKRREAYRDMADADGDLAGGGAEEPRDRGRRAPAGDKPPTLKELASDGMAGFRKRVIDDAIKPEALRHLLTDMEGIYTICRGEDAILLDAGAAAHMERNAATIRAALGHMIVKHLEATNPSARHLATMADLSSEYAAKIKRVRKQEASAAAQAPQRDDISPLYTMSLDLAAGLARLSKPRERGPQ